MIKINRVFKICIIFDIVLFIFINKNTQMQALKKILRSLDSNPYTIQLNYKNKI